MVWRRAGAGVEVAVVHRPRYDDWSWPKGGVDGGEHAIQAAAREVAEEAGVVAAPGRFLGVTEHDRGDGRASVSWWEAEALSHGGFEPGEVDETRWVTPEEAAALLSYEGDRQMLAAFTSRPLPEGTLVLVRHAQAGNRHAWKGPDDLRPLSKVGRRQADRLGAVLRVFAPQGVFAAEPVRCPQTVQPLADALGLPVAVDEVFGDAFSETDPDGGTAAVLGLGARPGRRVLCSQGGAIPTVLQEVLESPAPGAPDVRRFSRRRDGDWVPRARKGSTWVLTFRDGEVRSADYFPDFAPGQESS